MTEVKDAINWFEIPVLDVARAARFYSEILGISMKIESMGPSKMAMFPGGPQRREAYYILMQAPI